MRGIVPPRLSLRWKLFWLLLLTGILLFAINTHQQTIWLRNLLHGKPDDVNWATGSEVDQTVTTETPLEKLWFPQPTSSPETPWFMWGGGRRPAPAPVSPTTGRRRAHLWPHEAPHSDRIIDQLMFVPPADQPKTERLKEILFYHGLLGWGMKPGRDVFLNSKCPVDTCSIVTDRAEAHHVDAIFFTSKIPHLDHVRPADQVWILYDVEPPHHGVPTEYPASVNWTATYRRDSDVVYPYGRWVYYDPEVTQNPEPDRNYATNKTKMVGWFVSNCAAINNRLQYAYELKKHIPVDIYGKCGELDCPRFPLEERQKCFEKLAKEYKFYLAFENCNCREYITEKLFINGLQANVLPIVMGAHPDDYAQSAPSHSYIHVDDFASPEELANYLRMLDEDDDLYNSYFRWKGTGEFINTYFFCRLCAMLHDDYRAKSYRDVNEWWRGPGVCADTSWIDWEASHEQPDQQLRLPTD